MGQKSELRSMGACRPGVLNLGGRRHRRGYWVLVKVDGRGRDGGLAGEGYSFAAVKTTPNCITTIAPNSQKHTKIITSSFRSLFGAPGVVNGGDLVVRPIVSSGGRWCGGISSLSVYKPGLRGVVGRKVSYWRPRTSYFPFLAESRLWGVG